MAAHNNSKTGYMAVYDSDDTVLIVDGHEIYGYATSGDMVQVQYDADTMTSATDPQGTAILNKLHKGMGTITVNLTQGSPCNALFTRLSNEQKEFAIDCSDSTDHSWDPHAYISRIAQRQDGETGANRAWTIHCLNLNTESKLDMQD